MVLAEVAERSRYHGTIGLHTSFELVRFRQAKLLSCLRCTFTVATSSSLVCVYVDPCYFPVQVLAASDFIF